MVSPLLDLVATVSLKGFIIVRQNVEAEAERTIFSKGNFLVGVIGNNFEGFAIDPRHPTQGSPSASSRPLASSAVT